MPIASQFRYPERRGPRKVVGEAARAIESNGPSPGTAATRQPAPNLHSGMASNRDVPRPSGGVVHRRPAGLSAMCLRCHDAAGRRNEMAA